MALFDVPSSTSGGTASSTRRYFRVLTPTIMFRPHRAPSESCAEERRQLGRGSFLLPVGGGRATRTLRPPITSPGAWPARIARRSEDIRCRRDSPDEASRCRVQTGFGACRLCIQRL